MIVNNHNRGYRGNKNLRREGEAVAMTEHEYNEFIKCRDDVHYFIENYVKIVHVDHGLIQFKPWPFQNKMIDLFQKERFVINKLPRQCGKTTTTVAFILHYIIFAEHKKVGILAHRAKTAIELFQKLRTAYINLPKWLQMGVVDGGWNKTSITLANGSKVMADATSGGSLRGETYNLILLDEFAHVENNQAAEFINSVMPVISSGKTTQIIIVSTPKGMNHFYDMWSKAIAKTSEYVALEIKWNDVPGRDENFKRKVISNDGIVHWNQEYECEFLGSSLTLISGAKLQQLMPSNPVYVGPDGMVVYEKPKQGHRYVLTVDVSRGQGLDYHAFNVVDVTEFPYIQTATYRNNSIAPTLLPSVIKRVSEEYGYAHILVEINDNGQQIADMLIGDLDCENVIRVSNKPGTGQTIAGGFGGHRVKPGLKMSPATKRIGCTNLKHLIESDKLILKDKETIKELTTFVADNQSFSADEGKHDDLVMSLVLFGWLSHQRFFRHNTTDIRSEMEKSYEDYLDSQITPFGVYDDGIDIIDQYDSTASNAYGMF